MKRDWNNTYESYELAGITIDGSINTLPQLNEEIVDDYRQAMREYGVDAWQDEWLEFPKITADGHLWSGFHTIAAALGEFGDKHVVAFEVEGKSRDDALLLATKENAKRGRKRSNEEKRVAVLRWLTHPKGKVWANSHNDDQDEDKMNTLAFVSFAHLHDLIPTLAGVITYIYILYQAK